MALRKPGKTEIVINQHALPDPLAAWKNPGSLQASTLDDA